MASPDVPKPDCCAHSGARKARVTDPPVLAGEVSPVEMFKVLNLLALGAHLRLFGLQLRN